MRASIDESMPCCVGGDSRLMFLQLCGLEYKYKNARSTGLCHFVNLDYDRGFSMISIMTCLSKGYYPAHPPTSGFEDSLRGHLLEPDFPVPISLLLQNFDKCVEC